MHQITIIPRGPAGGLTISLPEEDRMYQSRKELQERICTCLGGRVAEALMLDDVSTGASNDIEQATKLARAMITRYGMSEKFGMVAFETRNNAYLNEDATLSCSPQKAAEIDDMVISLVKQGYSTAMELLSAHQDKLHELAKYLYEKETITGEEFMEILNQTK